MGVTYDIVVTGCSRIEYVRDASQQSGYRQYTDTSPLRKQYPSRADAIREIGDLKDVLAKNPKAMAQLPDRPSPIPLGDWINEALGIPKPAPTSVVAPAGPAPKPVDIVEHA